MTDKQINTTLATACGWTQIHEPGLPGLVVGKAPEHYQGQPTSYPIEPVGVWWEIPNYRKDLNACHEFEHEVLGDWEDYSSLWHLYETKLKQTCGVRNHWMSASASQRAEALLRTMNLWEE